jgi:hypothetical protein
VTKATIAKWDQHQIKRKKGFERLSKRNDKWLLFKCDVNFKNFKNFKSPHQ